MSKKLFIIYIEIQIQILNVLYVKEHDNIIDLSCFLIGYGFTY